MKNKLKLGKHIRSIYGRIKLMTKLDLIFLQRQHFFISAYTSKILLISSTLSYWELPLFSGVNNGTLWECCFSLWGLAREESDDNVAEEFGGRKLSVMIKLYSSTSNEEHFHHLLNTHFISTANFFFFSLNFCSHFIWKKINSEITPEKCDYSQKLA